MAVDFNTLLSAPAGTALKPHVLPMGDYPGIIKNRELGVTDKKQTPYVKLFIGFTDWPTGLPEDQKGQVDKEGGFHPTDLSKRTLNITYWLTEDSIYRLEALFESCGISMSGKTRKDCIEELVGKYVIAGVTNKLNEQTSEPFAEIRQLAGQK